MINRALKDFVLIEGPVLDMAVNTHKHLLYYSAGAYIEMADFRITLITLGEPDTEAVRL